MLGKNDEKINVNRIETPDRVDKFIHRGIKKGRRRGKCIETEKGIKEIEFIDKEDVGQVELKVMIRRIIKKEDINIKIK